MSTIKKVRKAVIPAAGFGTRFLPATKAQPKEMLPIVDKPVIQYVVEQAVAAGIEQIIIVTGWHKRAIEDHFDRHFELEARLAASGKQEELENVRKISEVADFVYVRQKEMLGNGHAVLQARDVVGDEPFVVMWGDGFFDPQAKVIPKLMEVHEKYQSPVIAGVRVAPEEVSRYGVADVTAVSENVFKINQLVEKPKPEDAPSNLATHGYYLLTPDIFEILENLPPSQGGEIWLPEAIDRLVRERDVYAVEFLKTKYYDCGNKLEYLKAVVDFGLQHEDLKEGFEDYLRNMVK